MLVSPTTIAALDRITQRANDVKMAFTPGAVPRNDDVATARAGSLPEQDPLSIAPPSDAYFISEDERARACYTRDGSFTLANGVLSGSDGRPVLGYARAGAPLAPLRIDPVDESLGRVVDARIDASGSLSYARSRIDPRTGASERERVVVGTVALARFAAATKLQPLDANHFAARDDVEPHIGQPGDGNFARVEPGRRERSGVDIDASLARLHDAYVAFDALLAARKARSSVTKSAMDLLK